jgi:hypothetical protein
VFADLLLGRLGLTEQADPDPGTGETDGDWLEVEDIGPETGELLGTRWQHLDGDGEPVGEPIPERPTATAGTGMLSPVGLADLRRPPLRIGTVVPLSSLLGASDCPGELADRSGLVPAEEVRRLIADALGFDGTGHDGVLFTRLLTDDGGRLLDTTELGRFPSARLAQAIRIRAGTCRYPTCSVPADRCDLDHHEPWPEGHTSASNLDPLCRRHHRGKTFAWLAAVRDHDGADWTMPDAERYRCVDDPLPTGVAA